MKIRNNKFIGDTIDDEIQGSVPSWILELIFN